MNQAAAPLPKARSSHYNAPGTIRDQSQNTHNNGFTQGMKLEFPSGGTFGFGADDLKGFSRTFSEVEWLLLVLVLLYMTFAQVTVEERAAMLMALFFFGAFVLSFHYANFFRQENLWKLALEAGVMLVFITWVVMYSGKLASPLLNLYLLAIIASALTLGKVFSLVVLVLIAGAYLLLSGLTDGGNAFSVPYLTRMLAQLAPVVLVGYLTTMLAADIRFVLDRLNYMSQSDELTGLLNMRGFMPLMEREASRSQRYGHKFAVLMVDCDQLKAINDAYGHEAGNRFLNYIVGRLKDVTRTTDLLARYGGDEFLILLPETSPEGALLVAERMRLAVSGSLLDIDGRPLTATVSIGVALFPEDSRDPRQLIDKADQAMYMSKQRGKNVVSTFADAA